jgi:hypothetical protein
MAQKLNQIDKTSQATVANHTSELMRESLRKAEEIRHSLQGRKHTDSTILIAEDRKRCHVRMSLWKPSN